MRLHTSLDDHGGLGGVFGPDAHTHVAGEAGHLVDHVSGEGEMGLEAPARGHPDPPRQGGGHVSPYGPPLRERAVSKELGLARERLQADERGSVRWNRSLAPTPPSAGERCGHGEGDEEESAHAGVPKRVSCPRPQAPANGGSLGLTLPPTPAVHLLGYPAGL